MSVIGQGRVGFWLGADIVPRSAFVLFLLHTATTLAFMYFLAAIAAGLVFSLGFSGGNPLQDGDFQKATIGCATTITMLSGCGMVFLYPFAPGLRRIPYFALVKLVRWWGVGLIAAGIALQASKQAGLGFPEAAEEASVLVLTASFWLLVARFIYYAIRSNIDGMRSPEEPLSVTFTAIRGGPLRDER